MKKLKLAVIGKDVSQSGSPKIHQFIAKRMGNEIDYDKISIPEEEFENSIDPIISSFDGFNVTIPFKLSIMPHLEKICGDAKVFGAVNTVVTRDKSGYNTDGMGFMMMLENNGVEVSGKTALLLGAGGAGRSVAKKLLDGGAKVSVFDMRRENIENLCAEFKGITPLEKIEIKEFDIIINATGVGMHKSEGISPVGTDLISLCGTAVDLIYTPKKSEFLRLAESCGKKIVNGEGMLFYQAYYSECIYFGVRPSASEAKALFEEFSKE